MIELIINKLEVHYKTSFSDPFDISVIGTNLDPAIDCKMSFIMKLKEFNLLQKAISTGVLKIYLLQQDPLEYCDD